MAKNETAAARDPMEMVMVKIHRNPLNKGKGIYVNVNTHNFFIPYGVTTEVPRYIAEVVERSIEMDEKAAADREEKANKAIDLGEL